MATGIFSTTRVAGEGIALAMVSAMLAAFAQSSLWRAMPKSQIDASTRITEAAQRVATGDLRSAASLLPEVERRLLVQSYTGAFNDLLFILVGITVVSALIVLGFLGRSGAFRTEPDTDDTTVAPSPSAPPQANC